MSKKIYTIIILLGITVPGFSQVLGNLVDYGWLTAAPLPAPRWAHGTTTYRSGPVPDDTAFLVVVSGADGSFNNSVITSRLNTTSNVWTSLASIPTSRTQAQAYYYNGKIFFIGGYGVSFSPLNIVSVYTIASNSWSTGRVMPDAVGDYAGCQYNDSLIYIIGGYNGSVDVKTVQVYNAKTDLWSSATLFAGTAVAGARAGISGNNIILAGGYSQTLASELAKAWEGTIDPLNPANITWTAIGDYPAGPTGRSAATGIKGSKYIFFTGGDPNGDGTAVRNDTWAYDVVNNGWLLASSKTTGVSNIQNFVPLVRNDSVYLASAGGYNGTIVVTANEWLSLGRTAAVLLPLRLLDFSALLQSGKTQLKWRISEDGLGGKYIIQRSRTTVDFADFQNVEAGKTQHEVNYKSFDLLPYNGYTWYRIKIVSIDGAISYSPIRSVFNNKHTADIVASLYPNPSTGQVRVELQSNIGRPLKINLQISDISGHKITSDIISLESFLLKSYELKPGNYIIRIFTDDKSFNQTKKLVVL